MGLKEKLCRYAVPDEIDLKIVKYENVRERCGCPPLTHQDETQRIFTYLATIHNPTKCYEVGGQWNHDHCQIRKSQ